MIQGVSGVSQKQGVAADGSEAAPGFPLCPCGSVFVYWYSSEGIVFKKVSADLKK